MGFDSDELVELGTRRAIKFIDYLSECQDDQQPSEALLMFIVHIKVFIAQLPSMSVKYADMLKLRSALNRFPLIASDEKSMQIVNQLIEKTENQS